MMYKEVEYLEKNNMLYITGVKREKKSDCWLMFFWKFKVNGIGYLIFRSTIVNAMRMAKRNINLIEKYDEIKNSKKKANTTRYKFKGNYEKIRLDYSNGVLIPELSSKYGGTVESIRKIVRNETYRC